MIDRFILDKVQSALKPGKVVSLFGARRTGKTVLMETLNEVLKDRSVLKVNGENLDVAELLSSQRTSVLKRMVEGYDFLFIDEAQKVPGIGTNLKLLVDTVPGISVFVTGSSAFDLARMTGEPLTGRGFSYYLYPFAQKELGLDFLKSKEQLEDHLIFGMYPQVVLADETEAKMKELESIRNGYLLKDILELDNQKDSAFVLKLLRLLAFQIGNDISVNELAVTLQVNRKTIERFLALFEKTYITFSHMGYSNNLRKEISKSPRIYFWDNGIRNAVISNFNRLSLRDDTGRLWENYCISERRKMNHYNGKLMNHYFWRTYDKKEIDYIEEYGGRLFAYEIKWSNQKIKQPAEFLKTYPNAEFSIVHNDNYLEFIS